MTKAIILMGVSGSGKTTIGQVLSSELNWSFYDGDDYHSLENVEKMSQGIPLSDKDRFQWLGTLSNLLAEKHLDGENLVLACSALKQSYRQQLRSNKTHLTFVYLEGDFELIWERMGTREEHYMKPEMLKSQFEILEPPQDALTLSIDKPVSDMVQEIIDFVMEDRYLKSK
jgi:gluconokinase